MFTPNGERHNCMFSGEPDKVTGIGFVAHHCETEPEGESTDEAKNEESIS